MFAKSVANSLRGSAAPLVAAALVVATPFSARALIAAAAAETRVECQRDRRSVENSHEQHDNDLIRWRARWSGRDCRVDLTATGEVKFNADFTDIASVGNGGSVEITDVDGNTTRRMTLRPDRGGGMSRRYWVNDREQPWDDAGRRWLAGLLIELDRVSGVGIDYRFPALFAAGGVAAVLDDVTKMGGDYVRGMYLRRLLSADGLTDADYQRVATVVGRDMSSDYETGRVLRAVAERASLDNDAMRSAYLAAVAHMSSDYERSRVLQTIFAKSGISHSVAREAVRAASTFSSDYERSRVLLAAIENKGLSSEDAISVIETVARSSSDYEKSRVLLAVASRWTLAGESRKAYLRAADSIRSDHENRRVLAALVKQESR